MILNEKLNYSVQKAQWPELGAPSGRLPNSGHLLKLLRKLDKLTKNRVLILWKDPIALIFVTLCWAHRVQAPEFIWNAPKYAIRILY